MAGLYPDFTLNLLHAGRVTLDVRRHDGDVLSMRFMTDQGAPGVTLCMPEPLQRELHATLGAVLGIEAGESP